MNNKIYIFIGSKKDFESFLDEKIAADEDITYFMDLIKETPIFLDGATGSWDNRCKKSHCPCR